MAGKTLRNSVAQLNSQPTQARQGFAGVGVLYPAAYKTSTQLVNNSVVLVNDSELALFLQNGYWAFTASINILIANAAHNIRYSFSAPDGMVFEAGGVTLGRGWLGINGVASQEDSINNVGITLNGGTTSAWTSLRIEMGLHVLQPGTFQFQFAQGVAGASNTSILAGSTMRAMWVANNLGV